MMRSIKYALLAGGLAGSLTTALPRSASACGCFTPPDPSVPVVQAGERILFAMKDGQVTAHIQIQYAGNASEFGWLLPLPSLPTLELGTDELFAQLNTVTQPKYKLNQIYPDACNSGFTAPTAGGAANAGEGDSSQGKSSPLVVQDSIGPYDYAVLKADDKTAMLDWLAQNRYFVPAGTDDNIGPYLHSGAYFLALKLRSGKSAGDLQPVVVHYPSDLPMIPILLTSSGAQPHMGVQVWMLGQARAIPRNYYHTVLNDSVIDWASFGQNYNDVVIRATGEAPGKHSFITEYAGPSTIMQNLLDAPGRFGTAAELTQISDPILYVTYLRNHGALFVGPLLTILEQAFPEPATLVGQGVTAQSFYQSFDYYAGAWRQQNPTAFNGLDYTFDPAKLTSDIETRVVAPTLAAGALFRTNPYLTRLYTTLSPEDMNKDPVFSFNPDLPAVSNVHQGTETFSGCSGSFPNTANATIVTEQGWVEHVKNGTTQPVPASVPASLRIEILRDSGPAVVQTDNRAAIEGSVDTMSGASGCSVGARSDERGGGFYVLGLVLAALGSIGLRRRRVSR